MKFYIEQGDLSKAIGLVDKAVSSKTPMPIMEGMYIEAKGQSLILLGGDGDIFIQTKIPARVEEEGSVVLGARLFSNIVRSLPKEEVLFSAESNRVRILCASSEFNLIGIQGHEYPQLPRLEEEQGFFISPELVSQGLRATSFAVSQDDMRIALTGVLLDVHRDKLVFASLDGYRLAVKKVRGEYPFEKQAIVPSRSCNELKTLLDMTEDPVELIFTPNHIKVILGDTLFFTRLINGQFYPYEQLIDENHDKEATCDRNHLQRALERAGLLAREERANLVKLDIRQGEILVESNSDIGDVHELINCNFIGEDMRIAFNSRYLIEGVKALQSQHIRLHLRDGLNPCILKDPEDDSYTYLVLPVRLAV